MNKINLIGRLTKDTELRYNKNNNKAFVRFTVAVNRKYTNANGERDADFISCVAWEKTAELVNKYFIKGSEIGLTGRLQTGSYENEKGDKVYTTDVIVEEITFIGNKKESRPEPEYTGKQEQPDPFASFANEIELSDGELPF